jgi:hypothetical protein
MRRKHTTLDGAIETVEEASRPPALKKLDNHLLALALYFMHNNFARSDKTPANPYPKNSGNGNRIS